MITRQTIKTIDQNKKELKGQEYLIQHLDGDIYGIQYQGKEYTPTGKEGTDMKTGEPCKEFATYGALDDRLWLQDDQKLVNLD